MVVVRHKAVKYLQLIQYPKIAYVCLQDHDCINAFFFSDAFTCSHSFGHMTCWTQEVDGVRCMMMPQLISMRIIMNCQNAWIGDTTGLALVVATPPHSLAQSGKWRLPPGLENSGQITKFLNTRKQLNRVRANSSHKWPASASSRGQ